jgi:hypothetical protein
MECFIPFCIGLIKSRGVEGETGRKWKYYSLKKDNNMRCDSTTNNGRWFPPFWPV